MTTLLMVSFVVFGLFAYKQLPVAALPRVDFPTINVSANLPGASPETMASSIAAPLERQFSNISGISSMTSLSVLGTTNITLQFDLDRSIDGAALDVQSSISAALRRLPAEMPAPPSFRKVNPADQPILFLSLASETLPLSTVHEFGEIVLAQQISQIQGVAQVAIFGAQKYAVRIKADPDKISARGLTMDDVRRAIEAANSNKAVGTLQGDKQVTTIQASGQLLKAAEYTPLVIAWRNGAPVRLDEIAEVIDSVEDDQRAGWYNTTRSITLAIYRQSDGNTVQTVDSIKANLDRYRAQLPAGITLRILNDRSVSIRDSVEDVEFTLMLSALLVIMVIFMFLKSLSATIIPTLALPVSLIGTFAAMYVFGYSIDNISLLALTLSVGFVVDDAIVMLENIVRHIEAGMKPFDAALKGAREIGFTIISITLSLVAVFIPVFFMGGVVGRIFREFAVVISVAILVSGIVSLTLTPMLCARLLKPHNAHKKPGLFALVTDGIINGVTSAYGWTLTLVLKMRFLMLLVTFGTVWVSVTLYQQIPKGFFPVEDIGFMFGTIEAAPDTSFDAMVEKHLQVLNIVLKDPAVAYTNSAVGLRGANTSNMFIALKPKPKERTEHVQAVIGRLRQATGSVLGVSAVFVPTQNINLNAGRISRSQYQYTLQSADADALYTAAPDMLRRMQQIPILRDVVTDLQIRNPQAFIEIDREKAASYNITADQIRTTLNTAFGSRQISTIFTQAADYPVFLEANRNFQTDPEALSRLYVKAPQSFGSGPTQNVPLDAIASIRRSVGPLTVNRQAQQPAVTLSFNLPPGIAIGDAVEAIRAVERDANLPVSVNGSFSGTAQLFQQALAGQGILLLAAVLVIYIVLGVLYESFIHPITILSGLPSAGLGALLALQYYKLDLSVIAIIGILMLIGIVKKNAIMMIDFAIERRRAGVPAIEAIHEAAMIRFRPIIMTTLAAILGAVPIALGSGAGAELRQPLGIAVVGGLLVSQLLTLYITPVVYYYLDIVDTYLSGRGRKGPETPVLEPDYIPGIATVPAGAHRQKDA